MGIPQRTSSVAIPVQIDEVIMPKRNPNPFDGIKAGRGGSISPYNPNQSTSLRAPVPNTSSAIMGEGATRVLSPSRRIDSELAAQPIERWLRDPEKTKQLLDPRNKLRDAAPSGGFTGAAARLLRRGSKIGGGRIVKEFLKWAGKRGLALTTLATGPAGAALNVALWAHDVYTLYQALGEIYDIISNTSPSEVPDIIEQQIREENKVTQETINLDTITISYPPGNTESLGGITPEIIDGIIEARGVDFEAGRPTSNPDGSRLGFLLPVGSSGVIGSYTNGLGEKIYVYNNSAYRNGRMEWSHPYEVPPVSPRWGLPSSMEQFLNYRERATTDGAGKTPTKEPRPNGKYRVNAFGTPGTAINSVTGEVFTDWGTDVDSASIIIRVPYRLVQFPPRKGIVPLHKLKRNPRGEEDDMRNCCPTVIRKLNEIQRDMRMIKQWTGANNTAIRVPGNPFISNDGIEGIVPTGFNAFMENKIIRSQPELIWHFMDCLDGFFGQFPFTIKVPRRIREAAEQSGENLPVNVTVHNLEDAITEIIKLNMNLQDDERTIKALGMRAVLEAYQAREEAYKARNRIEVVIDWLGFKYKQVTKKLRASFTIPGLVSPDIANLIGGGGFTAFSIPGWEEEMGKDTLPTDDYADKQLDKFVEPSTNPVKAYELESSTEDLMDMMVDVKQAISIIKHSFTVSVGGSEDLEENLNKYLKDFETKVNQGTRAVKKAKGITEEPESLEDTDRYKQKDWRKFLEFTEEGYLPPDGIYRSPDGSQITIRTSGDNALPFNRTRQERPKIKDLTVE